MKVAIAVTYHDNLFGRLHRKFGLVWGHAALAHNSLPSIREYIPGYSYPQWHVVESTFSGVRERPWEEFISGVDECKIFELLENIPPHRYVAMVAYAHGNVGKPYNFFGLAKVIYRLLTKRINIFRYHSHICSGLVYDSFLYGGINLVSGSKDVLVTPDDLANSPLLKEVGNE